MKSKKNIGKLGIIVPAYNVELTLRKTIDRIPFDVLNEKGLFCQVYVINDGSVDNTLAIMDQIDECMRPRVNLINHKLNRGYGAAQKSGLVASLRDNNDMHIILHSDGQYAPEEMPDMIAPFLNDDMDVVIGSKFLKGNVLKQGMPFFRYLGVKIIDCFENLLFQTQGLEFHSGYMAYSTSFLKSLSFENFTDNFHFDGEMVLAAAQNQFKIQKVPISTCYDANVSSLKVFPYLKEIFKSNLKNVKRACKK